MVAARKEDPGADAEREPGGKNELKLFIFSNKAGKTPKKTKQNQNIKLLDLTD